MIDFVDWENLLFSDYIDFCIIIRVFLYGMVIDKFVKKKYCGWNNN